MQTDGRDGSPSSSHVASYVTDPRDGDAMTVHELLLPLAILAVALGVFLQTRRIRAEVQQAGDVDTDQLSAAIGETWRDLDLDETVGRVEIHAEQLREFHGDIATMLRDPRRRGEFGEQQLDVLLSDHLPPDMYGIREQVVDGKTPDAHIRSSTGLICIDAKFPLDNYEQLAGAEDEEQRQQHARAFRRDVERQLAKIADDYVRPDAGTTNFAFAFIPSESVYYHLLTEEYDLLRRYTKEGVQVVSPLTLGGKLELIKADVRAQKLSEEATKIQGRLERLGARFDDVEDEWDTLYRHLRNAKNKADDVDRRYESLRAEFDGIEQPSLDDVE